MIAQVEQAPRAPKTRLPSIDAGFLMDSEWAEIFQVEPQSIREWVYRNRIPHVPAFRQILISARDLYESGRILFDDATSQWVHVRPHLAAAGCEGAAEHVPSSPNIAPPQVVLRPCLAQSTGRKPRRIVKGSTVAAAAKKPRPTSRVLSQA